MAQFRLSALFQIAAVSALHALSLTGNVETDFASPDAVVVADAVNATGEETPDVGLPPAFPFPTSGWDIKDFRFVYDGEENVLYVGINFFGIAGDADGDGNPSSTSPALVSRGGQDLVNLQGSEAIQIEFDWNGDGVFDTIAGTPTPNATPPSIPPPDFLVAPDLSPEYQLPSMRRAASTFAPSPAAFRTTALEKTIPRELCTLFCQLPRQNRWRPLSFH